MPTKADQFEAERKTRCLLLLEEVKTATPLPAAGDLKKKSSRWNGVDATNVEQIKKILSSLVIEDVPAKRAFLALGGKGDRGWLHKYVRFLIEDHASTKRKALTVLKTKEKKARGAYDLRFEGLDQDARHAAWRREIWDGKKVTLSQAKFLARTGPEVGARAFWDALKAEERAATCTKAKADGDVREMTREIALPDAFKPGQQGDGAMPFGAGVDEMTGAWSIGNPKNKYIIGVVEKAAARRGVSLEVIGVEVAHVLLTTKSSQEQKLRRVGMISNGRSVTKAVTSIRDLTLLGVQAGERASSRLVAELREAPTDAPDVVVLGDWNRCDVPECLTTCGDAPSVGFGAVAPFGESIEELADALGCDVEELRADLASKAAAAATPAPLAIQDQTTTAGGDLGGGAASRGGLQSGRVGAARQRAAAVSASAPASLGAAVEGYDWERRVLDRASRLRSAPREPLVTAMTDGDSAAVAWDPTSQTFLADVARAASPHLNDIPAMEAALNERELHETPGGEMARLLLRWDLMGYDLLTGEGVAGGFIGTCEDIDDEEMRKKGLNARGKFYAPKIMHYALQKALVSGKLHFERDLLTAFYCIYGKLFYALTFWAGDITWLKAQAMGFDPTLVPLELPVEDLPMVDPSIAKRFPGGIVIESSDDLLPILEATNQKFFDFGKCALWAAAFAAYYGVGHPRALAALAAVGACKKDHERAALRVAACKKLIAFATGGDAGVSAVGAGACGDVLAVADGAAAPTAYVPFPSLEAALTAAVVQCEFEIRFAFPARKRGAPRMTQWYKVNDLVPVCAAIAGRDWDGVRSNTPWVFDSKLYRAMEDAACASSAVFAGTRLTEIASPDSIVAVFDPTCECKHDQTYTIWAGVDFEIMMPDGTVISKSEFLLQELEKYMAARA